MPTQEEIDQINEYAADDEEDQDDQEEYLYEEGTGEGTRESAGETSEVVEMVL